MFYSIVLFYSNMFIIHIQCMHCIRIQCMFWIPIALWLADVQFTDWQMSRHIRECLPRLHALSLVIALMQSFLKTWFWRASQWLVMEHGMLLTAAYRYVIYVYSLYINVCNEWIEYCSEWHGSRRASQAQNIEANEVAMNGSKREANAPNIVAKARQWMDQNVYRCDCSGCFDEIGSIDGIVRRGS